MRKIRTDTVMGEDLEKIFKKLNNKSIKNEEVKDLEEQKIKLQKQFAELNRKKKIQATTLLAVAIGVAVIYYVVKMI